MSASKAMPPPLAPALPPPQTFLNRVSAANSNVICTSKSGAVRKVNPRYLLDRGLRIPLFQRRYCWGEDNWRQCLRDVLELAEGRKSKHSFGRLTCVDAGKAGVVVVDGQQRSTSLTLILAACRDLALEVGGPALGVAEAVDGVLFRGGARGVDVVVEEGSYDERQCLVPTYCDRASVLAALLPPGRAGGHEAEWNRPLEAKRFFLSSLRETDRGSRAKLNAVVKAVLDKVEWLYFPLDITGMRDDGTEDLGIIFERLALRDAMFCRPPKKSQYAEMAAVDFIRNLLLGSFAGDETKGLEMYRTWWLPVERKSHEVGISKKHLDGGVVLEEILTAFLDNESQKQTTTDENKRGGGGGGKYSGPIATMIGGDLYASFREYVDSRGPGTGKELLVEVHDFAMDVYFAGLYVASDSNKGCPATTNPGGAGGAKMWSCTRCKFANPARAHVCTACNLQRAISTY
mmetsp:Transcript_16460/g.32770  ORF Transcript_16460/g.32770 Transcript_16460/m.32770 type:complete len:460 (+) Transcript_16460:171-1550(+)